MRFVASGSRRCMGQHYAAQRQFGAGHRLAGAMAEVGSSISCRGCTLCIARWTP